MIRYPLDLSKKWQIWGVDHVNKQLGIVATQKSLRTKKDIETVFGGDYTFATISFNDIKLSKQQKQAARWAKRTGHHEVLEKIYETEISAHQIKKT